MAPSDTMPTDESPSPHARAVSGLSQAHPTSFDLQPSDAERHALAEALGFSGIRKLRFTGEIAAEGKRDWRLSGQLGATVVQPCVVTLEPVVVRIDEDVARRYLARWDDQPEAGSETEMPQDDTLEPLTAFIDPWRVMAEALALAAPDFPRRDDAAPLEVLRVTEPGKDPLSDDDVKPFAGLAALKAQLEQDPEDG